ncbi:MAG: helix-turn-helix domain-containing protein [Thermoplasmata archaeon]
MAGSKVGAPKSAPTAAGPRDAGGCPVGSLFAMLGQPHMLQVLHAFLNESAQPIRFGKLQRDLDLSPRTLSHRLKALVEAGLLVRHRYSEIPPRVEYEATLKARELGQLFREMDVWASHNTLTVVSSVSIVGRA